MNLIPQLLISGGLGYIIHAHEPHWSFIFNGLGAFIEKHELIRLSFKNRKDNDGFICRYIC